MRGCIPPPVADWGVSTIGLAKTELFVDGIIVVGYILLESYCGWGVIWCYQCRRFDILSM